MKKTIKQKTYNKRVWLNKIGNPSTGNIVCYHGKASWGNNSDIDDFVSISDCHNSARLHKTALDTDMDFINKLKLLNKTISDFIIFLETNGKEN